MTQKNRILIIGMILFITGLACCGTAIADDSLPVNSYNNITIQKNSTYESLDVKQEGITFTIPFTKPITIKQSGTGETSNIIVIDGTGISDTINITLEKVNISGSINKTSAISLKNGAKVHLILNGSNTLTGGTDANGIGMAGIDVQDGCELTITSVGNDPAAGSLTASGGNGSEGGGAGIGSSGAGANCGSITIKNAMITATGGTGYGESGNGSAIGGGGGNSGRQGGLTGPIKISGTKTDIITVSGGIGRGEPGDAVINSDYVIITIENGNVLILDQPDKDAVFINKDGDNIYPITFIVKDNDYDSGISGVLISNGLTPVTMTRKDASLRLIGLTVPAEMKKYYDNGTATVWAAEKNNPIIFRFTADGYSGNKTPVNLGKDTETTGQLWQFDLIPKEIVEIPEPPKKAGGGSGTGSAKIVDGNDTNSTQQQTDAPDLSNFGTNDSPNSNENANQNSGDIGGYENEPVKTSTSRNAWIIAGVGLVVVAGVAGTYFYRKNK